jgi:preprotein translocase subunit SecD
LNNSAKYLFEEITNRLTGHRLAIIFDDVILNALVIQEKISGGIFSITLGYGNYSKTKQRAEQEVEEFSKNLILSTFTKFLTLKE